jgi:hypothetical protein
LLRGKRLQVILMVHKHPKDLLPFIWDAVPNEVRGASLTLGRTKRGYSAGQMGWKGIAEG